MVLIRVVAVEMVRAAVFRCFEGTGINLGSALGVRFENTEEVIPSY